MVLASSIASLLPGMAELGQLAQATSICTFLHSASYPASTISSFFVIKALGRANIPFLCSALMLASAASCLALKGGPPCPGR